MSDNKIIYPKNNGLSIAKENAKDFKKSRGKMYEDELNNAISKSIINGNSKRVLTGIMLGMKHDVIIMDDITHIERGPSPIKCILENKENKKAFEEYIKSLEIRPSNRVGGCKDHASGHSHYVSGRYRDEIIEGALHHEEYREEWLKPAVGKRLDALVKEHGVIREPDESDRDLRQRYAELVLGINIRDVD